MTTESNIALGIENQTLVPWLTTIGLITLMWSPIERYIDQSVHLIYTYLGGKEICKKKPRMLSAKLEFIEKCHKEIPALKVKQEHITALKSATLNVCQIRDVCVHGWIESWDNQQISIGKYAKSEKHIREIFTIDENRLNISAESMKYLSEKWFNIVNELEVYLKKVNPSIFENHK
jgi:hypothetical protein